MNNQIISVQNEQLTGASGKAFLLDYYFRKDDQPKPVILFAHGYKGFKDWGHWEQIALHFAEAGFVFVKFNFSHNGTTITNPLEFDDLEAFGNNNYSRELKDIEAVLDWLHHDSCPIPSHEIEVNRIGLIGHSRGGGISIILAANDSRIKALATWAAVSTLDYAWNTERIKEWKKEGAYYIVNGRTGQKMPMYLQMYQDFSTKKDFFDTQSALSHFNKPMLITHGTEDPAVPLAAAQQLKAWYPNANLYIIEGADHVFGGRHPYMESSLSPHALDLVNRSIAFFNKEVV